jgi:hypothetical protein
MASETPEGAVAIGSKFYFFKSATNSTDCLISAHGGYYKATTMFKVPGGVELIFYGVHGNVLSDPGVKLVDYDATPVQTLGGGADCYNYALSKYQGSHGGTNGKPAETYGSINKRIKYNNERLANHFKVASTSNNQKLVNLNMQAILKSRTMSVLTIRNRWFMPGGDAYLKDAVKEVLQAFPGIKRFHCSFCRGLVGDDNAATSKVQFA